MNRNIHLSSFIIHHSRRASLRYVISATLSVLCTVTDCYTIGWQQPAHVGYYKVGVTVFSAAEYADGNGTVASVPRYGDIALNLYAEYGLNDDFTLQTGAPMYKRITETGLATAGIGDIDIGVRYGLLQSEFGALNAGLSVRAPTGDGELDERLPISEGEFNLFLFSQFGASVPALKAYAAGELGVAIQTYVLPFDLRSKLEVGIRPTQDIVAIVRILASQSLRNGKSALIPVTELYNRNDVRKLSWGVEWLHALDSHFGVAFGFERMIKGRSALIGSVWSIGLYIQQ